MPRDYIDVNIPRGLLPYFEELLKRKDILAELELHKCTETPSGLGKWIVLKYLIENTSYRFTQINADTEGVKILDRKISMVVQIYIRPTEIFCDYDEKKKCEHIDFALTIPEIQDLIERRRREGWKI